MKLSRKSHKKVYKVNRRKSHKKKRTGKKKKTGIVQPVELSPIHNNLEDSPNSIHFDESPVESFSNMASQLDGGPSPSSRNTTVESFVEEEGHGNNNTMDIDELHTDTPSPINSSANTTRDRSLGGKKRTSRRKTNKK